MLTREMFCHKFYLLDGAGAGDGGGGPGISDAEAATFAASQESIGLGTLGLTAAEAADVASQGVGAAHGYGQPGPDVSPGPEISKAGEARGLGGGATTPTGEGGAGGVEAIKEEKKPVVPEVTPEVTKEKEKEKEPVKGVPKAKKRQRRPTILTDEEGLMYTAPGKRRSLLGG